MQKYAWIRCQKGLNGKFANLSSREDYVFYSIGILQDSLTGVLLEIGILVL